MIQINVAMEIVSLMVTIVLLICSLIDKSRNTTSYKIFTAMLVFNALLLLEDIFAWSFNGIASFNLFLSINASIGYSIGYIVSCLLSHYISACLELKPKKARLFTGTIDIMCIIAVALVIISAFNKMFFTYNNGVYSRGNMYWLSQAIPIIILLASEIMVLQNCKKLGLRYTLSLLSYGILPIFAMVIQYSHHNLEITYVASTISLLLIHVVINVEQSRKLEERERELAEARIDIMLSQIQPHFLYNSLTAIVVLCKDNPKAKKALMDFSNYLRINLDSITRKTPIAFEVELEHTKTYLALEKMRFQEKLNIVYSIRATDFLIPALTVQPLIENAVKHGFSSKEGVGTVRLATEETKDYFIITVADNGIGFDKVEHNDGHAHIGIENVRQRLMTMCGGELIVESTKNVGTTATIKIPKEVAQ